MKPAIAHGIGMAAVLFAASAGSVSAQGVNPQARSLAATCFTCHGTDGRSVGGVPPALAGQSKVYLIQQMKDFRDGKRPATIMHQQAKGYTDQEIELIASYFASVSVGAPAAAPAGRGY